MDQLDEPAAEVWVHPSVEVRPSHMAGNGLFATTALEADVIVIRFGGRLVNGADLHRLFDEAGEDEYIDTFAVGYDTHLVLPSGTTAHFGNHSCDPTMWPVSAYTLATRRAIPPGDELTIDYGVISDDPRFRMAPHVVDGAVMPMVLEWLTDL